MKRENGIIQEAISIVAPCVPGGVYPRGHGGTYRVTVSSPSSHRRAVWKNARFFRREMGYDFTQYEYEGRETDATHVAFLWPHREAIGFDKSWNVPCVGACCFRVRESGWGLQWVYFHPFYRRRGLLSESWPGFVREFGAFDVERPISEHMKRFLAKHNAPAAVSAPNGT